MASDALWRAPTAARDFLEFTGLPAWLKSPSSRSRTRHEPLGEARRRRSRARQPPGSAAGRGVQATELFAAGPGVPGWHGGHNGRTSRSRRLCTLSPQSVGWQQAAAALNAILEPFAPQPQAPAQREPLPAEGVQ